MINETVGDLVEYLKAEDKSIEKAQVFTKGKSTSFQARVE